MAAENIGALYTTKIPGYEDAADIQAALRLFHYGSTTYDETNTDPTQLPNPSLARHLQDLRDDVTTLEGQGTGSDYLNVSPAQYPTGKPDGFIWVDATSTGNGAPIYAAAVYTNEPPTTGLVDGIIWVDKNASPQRAYIYNAGSSSWVLINELLNIIDASGDLIYGTGADSVTRLPIGSVGKVLKVSSSNLPSWEDDETYSLPAQSGNAGKFLTTDGSTESWGTVSSGAVVQVKQFTYSTAVTTSSTSYISTGLTGSITPTSASNKILVMATVPTIVFKNGNDAGADLVLYRGSTQIYPHTNSSGYRLYISGASGYIQSIGNVPLNYVDSPASTSAQTYTVYFREMAGGNGAVTTQRGNEMSTLILMEVTP
jgi:hypothetical protein